MDLIYGIFIYPLELIMDWVLQTVLSKSGDPFLSLLCLSAVVSIGALPFYHLAEKWQDSEREIQKKLNPKIKEFKSIFKGAALNSYIRTLYRQNNYHPFYAARTSFGLLIQIPFFFAAYHLLSNYIGFSGVESFVFKDLGKPDGLIKLGSLTINLMPFLMTGVNLLSAAVYGKKTTLNEKMQLYGIAFLFLIVLYSSSSALLLYWTFNNIFSLLKNSAYNFIYKNGVITEKRSISPNKDGYLKLFTIVLLSLSLLIFVSIPLALLSSGSQDDIPGSFYGYMRLMLAYFFTFIVAVSTVNFFLSDKIKYILLNLLTILMLSSTVNAFLFSPDYGEMTGFRFENPTEITFFESFFSIILVVLVAVTVILLFRKNRVRLLKDISFLILFSILLFSFFNGYSLYSSLQNSGEKVQVEFQKDFVFSKNNQNVIVVMLDRFIGGYIPEIIKMMPEIETDLDGFVWYSDTLSPGSDTVTAKPCIFGGWEYHGKEISSSRKDVPLLVKMSESVRIMPYNFTKKGFAATIYESDIPWIKGTDNKYIENAQIKTIKGKYTDIWLKENNAKNINDDSYVKILDYGIIRLSPPFIRKVIFDNVYESDSNKKTKKKKVTQDKYNVFFQETNKTLLNSSLKEWVSVDYLPETSEAKDNVPGQFYFMSSMLTHEPFATNEKFEFNVSGELKYPLRRYQNFKKSINALKHLYTDASALKMVSDWIRWMKDNGVYDNTRIVLVSDHGRDVYNPMFKQQKIPSSKKKNSPAHWHALLMVKDFNSSGKMQRDTTFMSTCDVPFLAMNNIVDGKNPYTGNVIKSPENKLPYTLYRTKFRIAEQEKYNFAVTESFIVKKESVFDLKNWGLLE